MHKKSAALALAIVMLPVAGVGVWLMWAHQPLPPASQDAEQAPAPPSMSQNEPSHERPVAHQYPPEAPAPPHTPLWDRTQDGDALSRAPVRRRIPRRTLDISPLDPEYSYKHDAQLKIMLHYTDLLEELALHPNVELTVRNILLNHLTEQARAASKPNKDSDQVIDVANIEANTHAAIRQDLATLLTQAELGAYDRYWRHMPARMLRMKYDFLRFGFPGLEGEEYEIISDVLVEEMFAIPSARFDDWGSIINTDVPDEQLEALEVSRQRLSAKLDKQQMAKVDKFFKFLRWEIEWAQTRLESAD